MQAEPDIDNMRAITTILNQKSFQSSGDIKMKKVKKEETQISAQALRQFAENRRIANMAVQKAIEENRKIGIPDKIQFAR
jgi:hypothetical protein